jgi:hypothetical protein
MESIMSAPKTDMYKQEKQQRGPMRGMVFVFGFALSLVSLMIWSSRNGSTPEGAETQIDGRTGAEAPAEGN